MPIKQERERYLSRRRELYLKNNDKIALQNKESITSKFHGEMNWEYILSGHIHIDHIKPCAKFDLSDPEQQKECFHYTNLQPLWWYDNLKKGTLY